jgi:hypothetical protein
MNMRIIAVLFCASLLAGCGGPNEQSVSADFLKKNPTATVISALPGEGDAENVYFHIKFKTPSDSGVKTEVWLYQKDLNSKAWQVTKTGLPDSVR